MASRASAGSEARTANLLGALAGVVADRTQEALLDAAGLSRTEAAALITLDNYADGEPLGLLRDATGLSHPGTVRLADRLEHRGFVTRRAGAGGDGRAVGLELTAAGRTAVAGARLAREETARSLLAPLSARQRRALTPVLAKLLAAATRDARDSRAICDLCDADACGHPRGCPVTQAAIAAEDRRAAAAAASGPPAP
jgi:DNA-binding MarR family transcriptional regulator